MNSAKRQVHDRLRDGTIHHVRRASGATPGEMKVSIPSDSRLEIDDALPLPFEGGEPTPICVEHEDTIWIAVEDGWTSYQVEFEAFQRDEPAAEPIPIETISLSYPERMSFSRTIYVDDPKTAGAKKAKHINVTLDPDPPGGGDEVAAPGQQGAKPQLVVAAVLAVGAATAAAAGRFEIATGLAALAVVAIVAALIMRREQ